MHFAFRSLVTLHLNIMGTAEMIGFNSLKAYSSSKMFGYCVYKFFDNLLFGMLDLLEIS